MFSVKMPSPFAASVSAFILGSAMLAAAPAIAETLVVRASGPSAGGFSPGKKLPDGASVTLKAGDVLTLLDGRGTRTLRGPGVFGATGSVSGGGASIASFIDTRTTSRARTGAVRSGLTAAAPRSPNLWYVDVRNPATTCIADPANVKLWHPAGTVAGTLAITGAAGKASVTFEAGESVVAWPAALPVTEGAVYEFSGAGLARPVAIHFTLLPAAEGLESTASTLIARKCDAQLDLLIETVALPDPMPG
ncbi:MAG TPA: hypothetical protein VF503_22955 [Sphingobium sp.]|uniref:hypothetical protein n=1 Tax=Sphingobium sp. TaxID=1912891 RepID=UPI002ED59217